MPDRSSFKSAELTPRIARGLPAPSGFARKGRVLFTTSTFPRWEGDSTTPFVLHLAQDLLAHGWQVDVLAPHAPGARIHDAIGSVQVSRFRYLWPESLETVCYRGGALVNLRRERTNWLKLPALVGMQAASIAARLMSRHYDLLHSHWILPQGFVGAMSARPLGIPHIVTVHGSDIFALQGALLAWFKRFALSGAAAVTANSRATEEAVRDLAPDLPNVQRIPMGVRRTEPNSEAVAGLRARYRRGAGPLLTFVGRLVEEKGVTDLLQATALLAERLPDVTAVIVGDGPDRAAMERRAREFGVGDRVSFTGWFAPERVPEVMATADVYVGPSRHGRDGTTEAQGLVFAEAMLAGTPVVATRLGGIVDAVRHEETGLLVNETAPEEIAAAVERLAADRALARRLAQAGRDHASRHFTRDASARAFSDLYARVTRKANRQSLPQGRVNSRWTT